MGPGPQSPTLPRLSVVVVVTGDTLEPHCETVDLGHCLDALLQQAQPAALEIIVPYHAGVGGISELSQRFPSVNFVRLAELRTRSRQGGSREHHDEMRACGVAAAQAAIIACLEDHVRPAPDWAEKLLAAHRQPFAAIGGAIENAVDRPLNWAVYFCDLGKYQNPVLAGESAYASTVNIAYKRSALEAVCPVWQDSFNETRVHAALAGRGEKLALAPDVVVFHARSGQRLARAMREFLVWGRSYGRVRARLLGVRQTVTLTLSAPLIPALLLARMATRVVQRGRARWAFVRALPYTFLLACAWSAGETAGYADGLRPPRQRGRGTPHADTLR
jgi:hypothetical protein